eukprot:TRINITY_DN861_c0_g1_i1.p1 TRINITY_DN861_c0_g1~~TRINITY_DN861_c0_g1_i1.p1  ORF type:complete len:796 (-),score=200.25 TRINITY_DN861_c0_g1_i1:64-2382(-)
MDEDYDENEIETNPYTNRAYSQTYYALLEQRKNLPVYKSKSKLLRMINENQCVCLEGKTGSGKTTQIPSMILEAGYANNGKMIACTQPRRVAAMSIAERVAKELDVQLGDQIGYQVRFDNCVSDSTMLTYLTDGMLLREAMQDPMLSKYSFIILDEAHERTLNTDILLGLLKLLIKGDRPDLKILIMSATLNAEIFQNYFDAPLLSIPGRLYDVSIQYTTKRVPDYVEAAISRVVSIHESGKEGDILVFLTGEEEIEYVVSELYERCGCDLQPFPLYASLPPHRQQIVFKPINARKVVVATNIAETSITIDGVVFVIDCGFVKQKIFNPDTRVDSLLRVPVSQAAATQRAGRAGRTQAGICYRLYPESAFSSLAEQSHPEMVRSNVTSVFLTLFKLKVPNPIRFPFLDPPAPLTAARAFEVLMNLGALQNVEGKWGLSKLGDQLTEFPIDPQHARCILSAVAFDSVKDVASIIAVLNAPQPWLRPKNNSRNADKAHAEFHIGRSDHLTLLTLLNTYLKQRAEFDSQGQGEKMLVRWCNDQFVNPRSLRMANSIRNQLLSICRKMGYPTNSALLRGDMYESIIRPLVSGFCQQVGYADPSRLMRVLPDGQKCKLHPSSSIKFTPKWVIYNEFVQTTEYFIRTCSVVEPEWLIEAAPQFYNVEKWKSSYAQKELLKVKELLKKTVETEPIIDDFKREPILEEFNDSSVDDDEEEEEEKEREKKKSSKKGKSKKNQGENGEQNKKPKDKDKKSKKEKQEKKMKKEKKGKKNKLVI